MRDASVAADLLRGPSLPAHLYVHVPFCASKCAYCDFTSVADASDEVVGATFRAMRGELTRWAATGLPGVLDTVYFGGGTPTYTAERTLDLLGFVRDAFTLHPTAEVTVEANPDSLDGSLARGLAAAGVTRVSLGVQSLDDDVLRMLGRRHDATAALRACAAVMDAGLDLAVDLICGVPGQPVASWMDTVERAAKSGAHHMSVYPLSIEEGTALRWAVDAGLADEADPDAVADMMLSASEQLGYLGLARYEVANYAEAPRYRSRHNLAYWTGRPYIGIGPAAHGMLDAATGRVTGAVGPGDADTARVRYANPASIDSWLSGESGSVEALTAGDAAREDVMLGLRLVAGVPVRQVEAAEVASVLESLRADGLTELVDGRWRTTERGWLLGNEVFGRVWNRG